MLTGFPNYPHGKLYPGYKLKLIQREVVEGVSIIRVPLYASHDGSALKRILNYISFAASAVFFGLFSAGKSDVIYAYHPPLTVGMAACIIGFFRRTPIVYDIQDMWPDTLRATGMIGSERILRVVSAACKWVYKNVDHIVVLSPGFKTLLSNRGVPSEKIEVIYNWADEAALLKPEGRLSEYFPGPDRFVILFAGNVGIAQSLDCVLQAAAILDSKLQKVVFVILGTGIDLARLKAKSVELSVNNVVFIPQVSVQEVGVYLNAADALLVHLKNDPLFEITIPSKTQAYMAVGKPVLMAVKGDASDLVSKADCGCIAVPEDPASLAVAAETMACMTPERLQELSDNARLYYHEHLSLPIGVARFIQVFSRAIKARR